MSNPMVINLLEADNGWVISVEGSRKNYISTGDMDMLEKISEILKPYRDGLVKYNLEPVGGIDLEE